jgi:lysosomal acid lipase/cholesteryl ester hydrolase
MIVRHGYPAETHTVTTEDGYILTMHRIPYSPKSPAAPNTPVVFLQHGLLGSSSDWVILGPNKSLCEFDCNLNKSFNLYI